MLKTFFSFPLIFLSSGHVSASRGMRDDHADRSDHGEPVVSGEQRSAEPLQGSGAREAERVSGELDIAAGRGFTRADCVTGRRFRTRLLCRVSVCLCV